MPVPMHHSNGFKFNLNDSDNQKKVIFGSDPLLSRSTTDENVTTKNGHNKKCLDTRRRASSASTSNSNGVAMNGNNKISNGHSSRNGFTQPILANVESYDSCRNICIDLAYDIVWMKTSSQDNSCSWLWKIGYNGLKVENDYIKTMRRTVHEISERHEILFTSMVKKLNINQDNFEGVFITVVDDIFSDGQINWGRIVTVYALCAKMAQHMVENNMDNCLETLAARVGVYVDESLGDWIRENGGWDEFVRFFPETPSTEERVWNGLMLTAVGLAGAAGLALFALKT